MRKSQDPRVRGASTNIHDEPTWSGHAPHINSDLFQSNPYYRCVVLQRLADEAHRQLDRMPTRAMLQRVWAEGGEAAEAALREVKWRFYGRRRVA